jgi:UDP-N-acetylmuramate: L-alanyl-gamma-D-glutamyl-meso-diaminopimelate ligase
MNNLPKSVHIVGICGVATSALAIALKNAGVIVTGSDKGFYPPVSTELQKAQIKFHAGWHPESFDSNNLPEVFIVGTASGSQNPETIFAKEHDIPCYSFAEAIGMYFVKQNSICTVGTWGKTSSSMLLSYILLYAMYDPTYMFGGISLSHSAPARIGKSEWSVFEGDEYKSSPTDKTAKFFYYKPSHLLMTGLAWDHADLYPTEESYFDAFIKLLSELRNGGFVVANKEDVGVNKIIGNYSGKVIFYGRDKECDFYFDNLVQNRDGLKFNIHNKASGEIYNISSKLLGSFQAENITGCLAMAVSLGIDSNQIIKAISEFKGMKRRLEKRYVGKITVFDDIAHSPDKVRFLLKELRSIYKGKILAIYEPNIGSRSKEIISKYDGAFEEADQIIIPRLTKLKVSSETDVEKPLDGEDLTKIIYKTNDNCIYIDDDEQVLKSISEFAKSNDDNDSIIVFMSAHGFRDMIESTVTFLHQQYQ